MSKHSTRRYLAVPDESRNQFGTFGGVFTPSILTILGIILFMRAGFVIGQTGILGAVVILLIAEAITAMTALSVSAIGTNMQVRGGGAYFLISRVLGPEFGGAIGIALFFAQALSVPFYLLGFAEAVVRSFPILEPEFFVISAVSAIVLFVVTYIGAGWAIRAQYFIMGVLILAIAVLLGGAIHYPDFSMETFRENMSASYTAIADGEGMYSFWIVFAIYFPAVTGILAGINMSGDLKDPQRSLPRGTLAAVAVGFVIYLLQVLIEGAAFPRQMLLEHPFETIKDNALFGLGALVVAGVFAATLSSALGSYMGAPRILQAVARDSILDFLHPFAKGTPKGDEPRRGLVLTGILTAFVLIWAGNDAGGGSLNSVASIITMFFLYTYGMINVAAFIEAFGQNPSFRPRFKWFHWSTALLGALGCIATAFLINPLAALISFGLIAGLLWILRQRNLETAFGDARRGFVYTRVRNSLLQLAAMQDDPKNWRPTILVFSGNPASRESLVTYAVWMEAGRGIVFLSNILVGSWEEREVHRRAALRQLQEFCREKKLQAFPVVQVASTVDDGVLAVLQSTSIGPIRPNLVVLGWTSDKDRVTMFLRHLRCASSMGMSLVLVKDNGVPIPNQQKRIDIWWRGEKNGHLMILLAHLMQHNWEWANTRIRVMRLVDRDAGREPAMQALESLLHEARVDGEVFALVSDRSFVEILHQHSRDAACVFMGFELPPDGMAKGWLQFYDNATAPLATTILVCSQGEENILA